METGLRFSHMIRRNLNCT